MKKKKLYLPALAAALTLCFTPMQACADYDSWYFSPFELKLDSFHYTSNVYGICLDGVELNANYMVSGILRRDDGTAHSIIITSIRRPDQHPYGDRGYLEVNENDFDISTLKLGDLLYIENYLGLTVEPLHIIPQDCQVEVIGNGVDIYGEDFKKVMRHEIITEACGSWDAMYAKSTFDILPSDFILPGDLTEDDQVTIVDAIALNKSLMAGMPLRDCAKIAADVDQNGVIDETDSLNILKHIVGLVPDLSALAE